MSKSAATAKPAAKAAPAPAKAAAPAAKAAPAKAAAPVAKKAPIIAAARPQVAVRKLDADAVIEQLTLPAVFVAPIRPDIVHFVHTSLAKNRRQAYAVSPGAGHQHSAESWGTGRAVARIPRVSGGGTSRAGQGAFGNMCRKGRMFAPTKTWRRWHRKVNVNQKRFAVASALAASALPGLVFARGHNISAVPEVPLVLDTAVESLTHTKQAIATLKTVGAYDDVLKAKNSRKLRAGVGKLRSRRHVQRRGPLVVYNQDNGIVRAFRNLPGVEVAHVDSLNLLQLAPGGHLGRFVVWSRDAFNKLNANWGSFTRKSTQKNGYHLPRPIMQNSDLTRLINSDEIQSKVRPAVKSTVRHVQHKNPLTNFGARVKLNPYAAVIRRAEILRQQRKGAKPHANVAKQVANARAAQKAHRAQKTHNYKRITVDGYVQPKPQPKPAAAKPAKAAAKPAAKPAAKK